MANETATQNPETAIRAELAKLEWMIPDAKRDLAKAAAKMSNPPAAATPAATDRRCRDLRGMFGEPYR